MAGIVLSQPGFKVGGMSAVKLRRVGDALENVSITRASDLMHRMQMGKEKMACHPKLGTRPSRVLLR